MSGPSFNENLKYLVSLINPTFKAQNRKWDCCWFAAWVVWCVFSRFFKLLRSVLGICVQSQTCLQSCYELASPCHQRSTAYGPNTKSLLPAYLLSFLVKSFHCFPLVFKINFFLDSFTHACRWLWPPTHSYPNTISGHLPSSHIISNTFMFLSRPLMMCLNLGVCMFMVKPFLSYA